MKKSSDPKDTRKKLFAIGLTICAIAVYTYGIWLFWLFGAAKHFANCDDGYTIWQRDVFLSFQYEIRHGTTILESNLTYNQVSGFMDERGCIVILGGG